MGTKNIVIAVAVVVLLAGGGWFLLKGRGGVTPTVVSGQIQVGGAGSGMVALEAIAPSFEAANPGAKVNFAASIGTDGGIKAVYAGTLPLGATARPPKEKEMAETPVTYRKVARDALVFAVHPSVTVTSLTSQQLRDIYTGKVTNWSKVGGNDLAIKVLVRPEDETPTGILRKEGAVFGPATVFGPGAVLLARAEDMVEAILTTADAIGYTSLGAITMESKQFKTVMVDGVAPSAANVESGRYPYFMELGVVTKGEPTGLVKALLDFVGSNEGKAALREASYLPL